MKIKKKKNSKAVYEQIDKKISEGKTHELIKKKKGFIVIDDPKGKGSGFIIGVKPDNNTKENKETKNKVKQKTKKASKKKGFKKRFNLQGTGPKIGRQKRLNGGWFLVAPMRD